MAHLYKSGNYIIGNDGTDDFQFVCLKAQYSENTDTFTVFDQFATMVIQKADISTLEDTETGGSFYVLSTLQDFLRRNTGEQGIIENDLTDLIWSAGAISGFDLTDNLDGTADFDGGDVYLRTSAVESAPIVQFTVASTTGVVFADNSLNYVFVDYNSGSPVLDVSTDVNDFNCINKCIVWLVTRVGTTLYYKSVLAQNVDGNRKLRRRFFETELIHRAQGIVIGATGLKPTATEGIVYFALSKATVAELDCAATGTFTYVYNNAGNWVRVTSQTDINNLQYSTGAGLATMTNKRYKVDWLYVIPDSPDEWFIVYGTTQYQNVQQAQLATEPSLPPELAAMGLLVGRYIVLKSSASVTPESAFDTVFAGVSVPLLSDLDDTDISGAQSTGASLRWNGTDWVDNAAFTWTLDFNDVQTGDIYPNVSCSIASVTNLVASPVTTILLNGSAYSFNDPIVSGDKISVTVDIASVIDLNFVLA